MAWAKGLRRVVKSGCDLKWLFIVGDTAGVIACQITLKSNTRHPEEPDAGRIGHFWMGTI